MSYLIPQIAGRLGNQLFEIAHVYSLALKYSKEWYVHKQALIVNGDDYTKSIFRNVPLIDQYVENGNVNIEPPPDNKHTVYMGFYQSEKYFIEHKEQVLNLFSCPEDVRERIRSTLNITPNTAGIHVRKGDYLDKPSFHPTISAEYVHHCASLIPQASHYLVVSDDIPWCRENIKLPNITFSEELPPQEDLWALSLCHDLILSNSSFSWWGAYLSQAENVFLPSIWFGQDGPQQWDEIYRKEWNVVETVNLGGTLHPATES